ncbi:CgeB family protein [Geobacter pickeringii]|uniref:Spore protein YkvP/CgeB glycosyl transferase-like domain-containing protein n=1 Tax=Geobacter pickeringii TaxID=345632 RepID=A0A0B5BI41_9BACT|nr:glycosyltransferase [Geobacter pickeringii]AJE03711.1 hypothetical protein GPICK_10430 [Geobacter pickeringii]
MKIVLNSRFGMPRLKEGLEVTGHEVLEDVWDAKDFASLGVEAALFEFRTIFNHKWRFIPLVLRLRKMGIPVATWNVDSPWHMNRGPLKVKLLLKSGLIDLYATHSLQDTERVSGPRVLYLPNAAWTSYYGMNGVSFAELWDRGDYDWDVSFLGNMNGAAYPEHRRRAAFLAGLEEFLNRRGLRVLFADVSRRPYSCAEQLGIIQRSRINLSCIAAADSTGVMSWGLTERAYGVPACGGFLLMEDRVHVMDDFARDEVATYRDPDDCREKISYYLDRPDERRRIAEKAHERVMGDHTYQQRAITLMTELES